MSFSRFWRGFRPRIPAGDRLGNLRKALEQEKIPYAAAFPELALNSLPAAMPPAPRLRIDAESFRFPLPGPVRIALLEGRFRADRNMREFGFQDVAWLRSYAPQAVVTPLDLALSLAERKTRGLFDLPSLETALVVLTSFGESVITGRQRDLLWRAFGVPVFEQLRAWDGSIVARECEVHDGLHIDESAAILQLHERELLATQLNMPGHPILRARTGLTGEIVTGRCECGAETPRLRKLSVLQARRTSAAA